MREVKKSIESHRGHSVLSWIVPFAVPMIAVLVILSDFSVKSSASARQAVIDNMMLSARRSAEILADELETMGRVIRAISGVLEQDQTLSDTQTADLVKSTADSTGALRVEFCDNNGKGIDQSGNEISIGEEEYFQSIRNSDESLLYVEEDEYMGRKSIVVEERLGSGRFMLIFYPVEKFDSLLSEENLDSGAFLALIDKDGMVISTSGARSGMLDGGNLLEAIRTGNPEAAAAISECAAAGQRGTCSVQVDGESRMLIYVPLGMNQWGIVMGAEQAYVDGLIRDQWKNARNMLISLVVVVFVFGCIAMMIDIAGRIRAYQQKKELENKADTDLLTGLNNKLATERKIKNYIAENPESQCMMFLLDVDDFKTFNDTMGHAFGDEVLGSLGGKISAIFRVSDIIGRVGGDEFMIFLKAVPTPEVVYKEAKKVEEFFRNFHVGGQTKYAVKASIGVAVFPHEGADFMALYKAADQALYKAKRRGKNQLAFYEDKWEQVEENKEV